MSLLAASAIIGGAAQLGQTIYGMVQGSKMMREAQQVEKPEFQVQQEFEQNRALTLNRYNAANPFIAQASANLNRQTASATIAAQQTAADSAAAASGPAVSLFPHRPPPSAPSVFHAVDQFTFSIKSVIITLFLPNGERFRFLFRSPFLLLYSFSSKGSAFASPFQHAHNVGKWYLVNFRSS